MKKWALMLLAGTMFLSGCQQLSSNSDNSTSQENSDSEEEAIIPKFSISDDYYKVVSPFKTSKSRGLSNSRVENRLDLDELESGLMRISTEMYSTEDHYYQEGQYLGSATIKKWLNRKYTKAQLKDNDLGTEDNLGLNPIYEEKATLKDSNEAAPQYLGSILEQNYLTKDSNGNTQLAGISIGLSMNTVYYYTQEQGYAREVDISEETLLEKGTEMAEIIVSRLREEDELKDVPIVIGLFAEQAKNSLVPGHYFAYATVKEGSSKLSDMETVAEKYVLFPSDEAESNNRSDYSAFNNFKTSIQKYFSNNYTGVVGSGHYINNELNELDIQIPVQFYGKAEIIGFTQYTAGLVMENFASYLTVNVTIESPEGVEAVISKKPDADEPEVTMLTP